MMRSAQKLLGLVEVYVDGEPLLDGTWVEDLSGSKMTCERVLVGEMRCDLSISLDVVVKQ